MTHGGPRRGAGRKPTGRRPYLIRMTPAARAGLDAAATAAGGTVPEYLDRTYGQAPFATRSRRSGKGF